MALTSKKEALSLSLIEGMLLGIPSVATDSGGPSEVVENGETGYITENGDKNALFDAFIKLIEDENLRKDMGQKAKMRAEKLFSVENMANELDKIYKEVFENREVRK